MKKLKLIPLTVIGLLGLYFTHMQAAYSADPSTIELERKALQSAVGHRYKAYAGFSYATMVISRPTPYADGDIFNVVLLINRPTLVQDIHPYNILKRPFDFHGTGQWDPNNGMRIVFAGDKKSYYRLEFNSEDASTINFYIENELVSVLTKESE